MGFIYILLFLGLTLLISSILYGLEIFTSKNSDEEKKNRVSFTQILVSVGGFLLLLIILLSRFIDIADFWG